MANIFQKLKFSQAYPDLYLEKYSLIVYNLTNKVLKK